jgi:8-oxo-dGTP diphosphatase
VAEAASMTPSPIVVTAAVIERDGSFLIARRQKGVHLEGYWEVPGGKCGRDESLAACLIRELREELDVEARAGEEIFTTTHTYPDRSVELHFLKCELSGTPTPLLGQELRWVARDELAMLEFPPADAEFIRILARTATPRPSRRDRQR